MEGHAVTNLSLEQMDVETTLHAFTPIHEHEKTGPHIITNGDGIYVTDNKGDTYIDAMASLFCVNAGYGRSEIGEAIADQARSFPYFHTMAGHANEQQIKLSDRLMDLLPDNMSRILYASSGSEANDANVKLAWMYQRCRGKPEKRKMIARSMGYHGVTGIATNLSGLPLMHEAFGLPLPGFLHTEKDITSGRASPARASRTSPSACRRAGGTDHPGGTRDRLRLHRGAGDGRGRLRLAARRLLRGDPGGAQAPRRALHRR